MSVRLDIYLSTNGLTDCQRRSVLSRAARRRPVPGASPPCSPRVSLPHTTRGRTPFSSLSLPQELAQVTALKIIDVVVAGRAGKEGTKGL